VIPGVVTVIAKRSCMRQSHDVMRSVVGVTRASRVTAWAAVVGRCWRGSAQRERCGGDRCQK